MNINEGKRIVILGGSFAGLTAAYELKRELGERHHVTVIDKNDRFVFIPSLIWVPFGRRTPEQISFPLAPSLARKGIDFLHATVERIDPDQQFVDAVVTKTEGPKAHVLRLPCDRHWSACRLRRSGRVGAGARLHA